MRETERRNMPWIKGARGVWRREEEEEEALCEEEMRRRE